MDYKRILLKISGEMLKGDAPYGVQMSACLEVANAVKSLTASGLEVGIVVGGGNIFRGINLEGSGMARTPADQMGMLATLINGTALQQAMEVVGCKAMLLTALECPKIAETYTWRRASELLSEKYTLIFAGGTGNPYFTTDTAAALRASEIGADVLLKATKVDGVFSADPSLDPSAKKYDRLTYDEVLTKNLRIMDATSVALCRTSRIPILVFNMQLLGQPDLLRYLSKTHSGTIITEGNA